jgi:hypothetical protein
MTIEAKIVMARRMEVPLNPAASITTISESPNSRFTA